MNENLEINYLNKRAINAIITTKAPTATTILRSIKVYSNSVPIAYTIWEHEDIKVIDKQSSKYLEKCFIFFKISCYLVEP